MKWSGWCSISAPFQYRPTKDHAKGPAATGRWMKVGLVLCRKYRFVRLRKLMIWMTSAQMKCERTKSMTKAKCRRLLRMKWLPTLAAAVTCAVFLEKRWLT